MKMTSALVLAALMIASARAETDCEALYQQRLQTDLSLSYEEFDQTMGGGFRALAQEGCEREAADLIEAYVEANDADQNSLRWHIAQLRASHGDSAEAIRYARASLLDEEAAAQIPLRWNDYVRATIAFLEKDLEVLVHHRDRVAEGVEDHRGNAMNLRLLDAMIEHFDATYSEALRSLTSE